MATLVTKTIGPVGCNYRSLAEFEALNYDLTARDEYWEVTLEDECFHQGATFSGWTTDSTRYIHLKGKNGTSVAKPWLQEQGFGMATIICQNASNYALPITISSIGANGYIILENLRFFYNSSNGSGCITLSQNGAVTLDIRKCYIHAIGHANCAAISITGNNNNVLKIHNTIINGQSYGIGGTVTYTSHVYNCTIFTGTQGIDLRNNANSVVKNTYIKSTTCLANIGAATLTTVATSDATGSVGLQNVAFDHTNFKSIAREFGSRELMTGSTLIAAGTSIVGQAAPFDYTTDFWGKPITALTPDIGACQWYAEDPIIINRYLIATGGDYSSMSDLDGKNLDLVTNTQKLTVHCHAQTDAVDNAIFNGWNTSSTYSLTIKGREVDVGGPWYQSNTHYIESTIGAYYFAKSEAGVAMIQVTDVGANGYVTFEDLMVLNSNNGAGTKCIGVDAAHGTVIFNRCKLLCTGNANAVVFKTDAGCGADVNLFNCVLFNKAAAVAAGGCIQAVGAPIKAYHCSAWSLTANGDCINMGDLAGGELVNCYAYAAGTGDSYTGLTDVTMTTCASDDATGSAGLQNVAYDATNFYNKESANYFPNIRKGGALYGTGTDLSGYTAPYNISTDMCRCTRPNPPSIGCCDLPAGLPYAGWTSELDIATADVDYTYCPVVNPVTKVLYFGTSKAANKGKIYTYSAIGGGFTNVYTHAANESFAVLCYRSADQLVYAVASVGNRIWKEGAPWTDISTADYLKGAAGNPAYPNSMLVKKSDALFYQSHSNGSSVHKDADGADTWTSYTDGTGSGQSLWVHPTLDSLWSISLYGMIMNDSGGTWASCQGFMDSRTWNTAVLFSDKTYAYIIKPDTDNSTGYNVYRALLSNMKFKRIAFLPYFTAATTMCVASGAGQIYLGNIYLTNGDRSFYYTNDSGSSWQICPTVPAATNGQPTGTGYSNMTAQVAAIWKKRWVFAQSALGANKSGVLYSDEVNGLEAGENVLFTFGGVV